MPDLGTYAGAVLSSYAATLLLLGLLIALSLWRGKRARITLDAIEQRQGKHG